MPLVCPHPKDDARVVEFLASFCGTRRRLHGYLQGLWDRYKLLDVSDWHHFTTQLTTDYEPTLWQRVWEMQLGCHLQRLGYAPASARKGPDFRIELSGLTVWIEAISPGPKGLPREWLEPYPAEGRTYSMPHQAMLLKWTSALKEKRERFVGYGAMGVVGVNDACVIAVNGGQLSQFPLDDHGITTLPWAIETVFPIGPIVFHFNNGRELVKSEYGERFEITNANDSPVALDSFLHPSSAQISALVGCTRRYVEGRDDLPLCVVHNPMARVPIPQGIFGPTAEEWIVTPQNPERQTYSLTRIR